MWVEIRTLYGRRVSYTGHPLREDVSWNAKHSTVKEHLILSSSSWGCELKCCSKRRTIKLHGHPLREDVSWNISVKELYDNRDKCHPLREDVSWNTYMHEWGKGGYVILFVRMWVEISFSRYAVPTQPVILFVRMWVEITKLIFTNGAKSSSSSWGCELK